MRLKSIVWKKWEAEYLPEPEFYTEDHDDPQFSPETMTVFMRGIDHYILNEVIKVESGELPECESNTNETTLRLFRDRVYIHDTYGDSPEMYVKVEDLIRLIKLWLALQKYD